MAWPICISLRWWGIEFGSGIIFKLIDLADDVSRQRMTETGREAELEHVTVLLTRVARVVTTAVGLIILLAHFGVNVTALTATLGLGGLAISLAAQDAIADAIAGVIILFDRPFRVGDRIHTALHNALAEAGIESPYPSQSLNVQVDDQTLAEVWQAWQGEGEVATLSLKNWQVVYNRA